MDVVGVDRRVGREPHALVEVEARRGLQAQRGLRVVLVEHPRRDQERRAVPRGIERRRLHADGALIVGRVAMKSSMLAWLVRSGIAKKNVSAHFTELIATGFVNRTMAPANGETFSLAGLGVVEVRRRRRREGDEVARIVAVGDAVTSLELGHADRARRVRATSQGSRCATDDG